MELRLFSVMPSGRTTRSGHKLKHKKFRLHVKNYGDCQMLKQGLQEPMKPPLLVILKTQMNISLSRNEDLFHYKDFQEGTVKNKDF